MTSRHPLNRFKISIPTLLVFMLLGLLAAVGETAYGAEKILLKGVPYFHQRWHFD